MHNKEIALQLTLKFLESDHSVGVFTYQNEEEAKHNAAVYAEQINIIYNSILENLGSQE